MNGCLLYALFLIKALVYQTPEQHIMPSFRTKRCGWHPKEQWRQQGQRQGCGLSEQNLHMVAVSYCNRISPFWSHETELPCSVVPIVQHCLCDLLLSQAFNTLSLTHTHTRTHTHLCIWPWHQQSMLKCLNFLLFQFFFVVYRFFCPFKFFCLQTFSSQQHMNREIKI